MWNNFNSIDQTEIMINYFIQKKKKHNLNLENLVRTNFFLFQFIYIIKIH